MFGLKVIYGDYVYCFFVEFIYFFCMLFGLMIELYDGIFVMDIGFDNVIVVDGLVVGRLFSFVGEMIKLFISGIYIVEDD